MPFVPVVDISADPEAVAADLDEIGRTAGTCWLCPAREAALTGKPADGLPSGPEIAVGRSELRAYAGNGFLAADSGNGRRPL